MSFAYEPVAATERMHGMPRWGYTDDFSKLFSEDSDETKDYIYGLLFGATLILSLFLIWLIVILVFKCMGQRRVGFLSGAPFTRTPETSDIGENFKRPIIARLVFLSFGLILITFGVLLVTKGVTNLRDTVQNFHFTNREVRTITREVGDISTSLRLIGESTKEIRDSIVENLGNFCPGGNTSEVTDFNIDEVAEDTVDLLDGLGDFLNTDLLDLEESLDTAVKTSEDVEDTTTKIDLNDWQALIVLIPLIVVPSILMVAVLMAMFESSHPTFTKIIDWFFLPLFVLITLFAIAGCGAIMIVSTANADWCYGSDSSEFNDLDINVNSPDSTVFNILNESGISTTGLVFRGVRFYVSQCRAEDPFVFIDNYKADLTKSDRTVSSLSDVFDDVGISRLSVACGIDFAPFQALVKIMDDSLKVLIDNNISVLEILRCDRITPIYTNLAYDATCNYSMTGVTWIWSSLLIISTCSMIMIMLRSSMQETVFEDQMLMNKDLGDAQYQDGEEFEGFEEEAYVNEDEQAPVQDYMETYEDPQMHTGDDNRGRNDYDM